MRPSAPHRSLQRRWSVFAAGLAGFAVVLLAVVDVQPELPPILPLTLAAGIGAAGWVLIVGIDHVLAATPPPDDDRAVVDLRRRLDLQGLIAETVLLATTVLAALSGPRWTIAVGALAAGLGLWRVRPAPSRLERFDRAWRAAGAEVSLTRALLDRDPSDAG